MKTIIQLFTIVLLLVVIPALGQTNDKTEDKPYIEVTGTAEQEVVPDEIYIAIMLQERIVNKTKMTIEDQEAKLKEALKSLNIDLNNLYLTDANADYVKISWKTKNVMTKKSYTLKVPDASTVGKVYQELDKLEITDAFISRVNHSKIDSLRKEIRILAIKAAKHKADYLLNAIGEQAGKPLVIKEYNSNNEMERMPARSSNAVATSVGGVFSEGSDEIQFQKIKLYSSIYIKFEIK
jgi:uncharacterized protein